MRKSDTVICRPCKEKNDWEIQGPDGKVYSKHYRTKSECVKAGRKVAEEYSCDMEIEDLKDASKATQQMHTKRGNRQ